MATAQIYISYVFDVLFSQTRGRGRSQLNLFQPRAVQRSPATASLSTKQPASVTAAAGDKSAGTDTKCSSLLTTAHSQTTSAAAAASSYKKMNNDAFRAMFLSNK